MKISFNIDFQESQSEEEEEEIQAVDGEPVFDNEEVEEASGGGAVDSTAAIRLRTGQRRLQEAAETHSHPKARALL